MLKRILRRAAAPEAPSRLPDGQRVYAIGDVHGCDAQFATLLERIATDDAARAPAQTTVILLGDLVDRGPDSAGVIARAAAMADGPFAVRYIAGNHEEMLLGAYDGDPDALRGFCRNGGRETLLSYGLSPTDYERLDYAEVAAAMQTIVPPAHVAFLRGMEDMLRIGDYAFVHAGIRPGVALDAQSSRDLRWIRRTFLEHEGRHEKVVVHGHTIEPEPVNRRWRIGVDTGAYTGGPLTALVLDGEERAFLSA
jgi:serine/threonine protein phosphatase 1